MNILNNVYLFLHIIHFLLYIIVCIIAQLNNSTDHMVECYILTYCFDFRKNATCLLLTDGFTV